MTAQDRTFVTAVQLATGRCQPDLECCRAASVA